MISLPRGKGAAQAPSRSPNFTRKFLVYSHNHFADWVQGTALATFCAKKKQPFRPICAMLLLSEKEVHLNAHFFFC